MARFYIGLSSPHKFMPGAWVIQKWMKADYSHAYVRFDDKKRNISMVYQASHGMVHYIEFENFKASNQVVKEYVVDVSEEDYLQIRWLCDKLAGQKYGYSELIKIAMYDVSNGLGFKVDLKDGRGYICSELVGKICTDRLGMIFAKPKFLLTPKDVDIALAAYEFPVNDR